ncbi:MAG: DUF58 domain-containing protein [Akkermansiaceae bacterium]|jgi:uncharacterized protein (DUF58 family)|nr:DUF58 domain-containing protein [Akkermansiaceae bacterium]MBJ7284722.1 DUF58 domain-containing protein [Akkermansiaceae bacterium]MBJ7397109.1 DUF58 domain-containing protein [Akkermansiaceae bacterium]
MLSDAQIEEMMARVRKLELKARRLVRESFSGEYLSSFRGQGLDFDDFREYQHGDEVRFIDWNVTARMNTPFVRKFREERELSVVIAVDVSGSADYGSVSLSKREVAAETAAVLGFSALHNGDKVGLLVFANEPILFIPPGKGSRHLLRMIREILVAKPEQSGTSVANACDFLVRMLRRKSLVFLISDFFSDPLEKPIGKLAKKHETIGLRVLDPVETKLPKAGKLVMIDSESGFESLVNTGNSNLRMSYAKLVKMQLEGVSAIFKKHGVDSADLFTHKDTLAALHQLLKKRSRRRSG